jgi:hypothetical protein
MLWVWSNIIYSSILICILDIFKCCYFLFIEEAFLVISTINLYLEYISLSKLAKLQSDKHPSVLFQRLLVHEDLKALDDFY